jgi:hypothetical protein
VTCNPPTHIIAAAGRAPTPQTRFSQKIRSSGTTLSCDSSSTCIIEHTAACCYTFIRHNKLTWSLWACGSSPANTTAPWPKASQLLAIQPIHYHAYAALAAISCLLLEQLTCCLSIHSLLTRSFWPCRSCPANKAASRPCAVQLLDDLIYNGSCVAAGTASSSACSRYKKGQLQQLFVKPGHSVSGPTVPCIFLPDGCMHVTTDGRVNTV